MNPPGPDLRPRQPLLDSLRGWAAVSVVIYHTFALGYFAALPGVNWLSFLQANRAAVLLFFTLSGYVIGATNTAPWSWAAVRRFGWRRVLRLEPIYLVALLLGSLAVARFSLPELLGNLFFLQNFDVDNPTGILPLAGNNPLWSLHYEVLYYLLFVLWWRWPATIPLFLAGALLISVGGGAWPGRSAFLTSHGTGMVFWLAGLLIARRAPAPGPARGGSIWAHVSWLHAAQHASTLTLVLSGLHLMGRPYNWLHCGDFVVLPGCVTLVAIAGGRQLPWARCWPALSFLVCLAGCVIVLVTRKPLDDPRWVAVLGFTFLGLLAAWLQPVRGLQLAARVGAFSYGLYALHTPILIMVAAWCSAATSTAGAIGGALAAWTLAFGSAAWLELHWQPRIRAWLEPARPPPP